MDFNYYPNPSHGHIHSQIYHFDSMDQLYNPDQGIVDLNMIDPSLLTLEPIGPFQQVHGMQVQKFLGEPERALFNVASFQHPSMDFIKPYEAQAPFPYANDYPVDSSSPTESSSTFSPKPESEMIQDSYYQRQSFDSSSPLSRSVSHISNSQGHGGQNMWQGTTGMTQSMQPYTGVVSLSNLQGIPDPEEVTFQDEEGLAYLNEMDSTIEVDTSGKSRRAYNHYRHESDSAIGQSVKDEDENGTIVVLVNSDIDTEAHDEEDDADAEADAEEEIPQPADSEEADPDFSPRSSRTSKRKRTSTTRTLISPAPQGKRQKIASNKAVGIAGGKNKCTHTASGCSSSFTSVDALKRHVAAQHTRPYVCTFAFAGCDSTFGNKNEWKRHVASQHLGLKVWICRVGSCASKSDGSGESGAVFNRKDLFTQHLRRMHSPLKVKHQKKNDAKWEAEVKDMQQSAEKAVRDAPAKTRCPVVGCGELFEGQTAWDERMEHMGRHLEGAAADGKEKSAKEKVVVREEGDEHLMSWGVVEGIIEKGAKGRYIFSSNPVVKIVEEDLIEDEDEDADGEDE